jgi:hypothetical protein
MIRALTWLAAGYSLARALEARSLGIPLAQAFQPNATLFLPLNRLYDALPPVQVAPAVYVDSDGPLPLSW